MRWGLGGGGNRWFVGLAAPSHAHAPCSERARRRNDRAAGYLTVAATGNSNSLLHWTGVGRAGRARV